MYFEDKYLIQNEEKKTELPRERTFCLRSLARVIFKCANEHIFKQVKSNKNIMKIEFSLT